MLPQREKEGRKGELGGETELGTAMAGGQRRGAAVDGCLEEVAGAIYSPRRERISKRGMSLILHLDVCLYSYPHLSYL